MLTLPVKFAAENLKQPNNPAFILKLVESEQKVEKTLEADWAANTGESNVDYDSTPAPPTAGDVILADLVYPTSLEQTTQNTSLTLNRAKVDGADYFEDDANVELWQSFKPANGHSVILRNYHRYMAIYMSVPGSWNSISWTLYCELWSASKAAKIGNTVTIAGTGASSLSDRSFNFSSQGITLSDSTEYWFRVYAKVTGTRVPPVALSYAIIEDYYQNSSVYADGQADKYDILTTTWTNNIGDAYFKVDYSSVTGKYYNTSGYIQVDIDMTTAPTVPGEWRFNYLIPSGTSVVFTAWASATGAFAGEETSLGTVVDGTVISTLLRYYRARATLAPSSNRGTTPTLKSILAVFQTMMCVTDRPGIGYEASLRDVPSLTTSIDTFKESTIGQVSPKVAFTKNISNWLATKYPKNKEARIYMGFDAPGFAETDFIDYYRGVVQDWNIDANDVVSLPLRDFSKAWKDIPIPEKWQTTGDDITWSAMHPVDVMLDILTGYVGLTWRSIDENSFNDVKLATPGWVVTRTLTGKTFDAKELLEELRLLLCAFFVPRSDGRTRLVRWDPDAASTLSLTDNEMMKVSYQGNASSLINRIYGYFNLLDDETGRGGTISLDVTYDSTSQTNWGEIKTQEIKDKWTVTANLTQVQDLTSKLLTWYKNIPNTFKFELDRRFIACEAGDMIDITTQRAPSSDMTGISAVKYLVINRDLDPKSDTLKVTALRAA